MKKMILFLLLLIGLFPASAREKHFTGVLLNRRSDAALLENVCSGKQLDLVFIIDSSRSVRPYDFEKVKEFILTILRFLDINPDVTRVGLIQYGSTIKNEFSLKTFRRKQDVERAVQRMMRLATGTMTGLAIQYAVNIAFSEHEGARPLTQNVPRVVMIVTDGRPQDPVAEVAAKARNSGILIFAIGVGTVDMNTLKSIGSEPYEDHVFLVANFSQIETLTSVFQTKLCVVDYCALNNQGCQHECVNAEGSYYCQCQKGFILNPDKKTCRRINACAMGKHGCEHECVNTEDTYVCSCRTGYTLNRDRKTCKRIDHCAESDHGCEHLCLNTGESYVCQCSEGFIINEDLKTCSRVDYCLLSNHGCEHLCVNSERSYACQCYEGYVLHSDGKTCRRKLDFSNPVHLFVYGIFQSLYCCYQKKKMHCLFSGRDICKSVKHGCEQFCASDGESYVCKCHEGFVLREDGKTCRNKDLCRSIGHDCEHLCVNSDYSYVCKCHEGFVLRDDGKTCRNQDVCKSVDHGCEHICVNNEESYTCKCHEGFVLKKDGKTCRRCTEGPVDLVLVIDGSKSLGENNFEIVKEFVIGILDTLTISPKSARVGLLQYSTQVRTEFTLKQFSTAKDMKKAVSQMKYMGKGSMTGLALKQMTERSFTEAEGARRFSAKVPRLSVVFTDGRAQDDVSEWAAKAKQNGITIYAVGIGKAIEEELQEIASDPPDKHLFYAEDFSAMEEIIEKLQKRICEGIKHHINFTSKKTEHLQM
ncbi:hypothetical protein lerEdw1_008658 [Lerista edwardsae]|nr:hypothetical protein lerEdw1_008658 [Lerista edwardsae]